MQKRRDLENLLLNKIEHKELYFDSIDDCLLNGIKKNQFIDELEEGDGKELKGDKPKFLSISSSSALAVNSFAFFKDYLNELIFLNEKDFIIINFEKKLENGLISKFKPNLDIYIENKNNIFAIESKFLEFLSKPKVVFSQQYVNINDSRRNTVWYDLMLDLKNKKLEYKYFDAAQIIKHYYGLSFINDRRNKKLIYLYWIPANKNDYSIYISEIKDFSDRVKDSTDVKFEYIDYLELWEYWKGNIKNVDIRNNIDNLIKRYKL